MEEREIIISKEVVLFLKELKQYGNYYVKIKGSKRTTWYVFFDKNENRYLVEFTTNNHTPHSAYLNKL